MTSPQHETTHAADHARAVWLLGLVAKQMQPQTNGTAALTLSAGAVRAVAAYRPDPTRPVAYSRAEAHMDGQLVDVSAMAAEAGFNLPTAMTRAAWVRTVEWSDDDAAIGGQDDRLWDVVSLARAAFGRSGGASRVPFSVAVIPPGRRPAEMVGLTLVWDGGDDGRPVATIMFLGEVD
jgi:hypothetical protein